MANWRLSVGLIASWAVTFLSISHLSPDGAKYVICMAQLFIIIAVAA